MRRVAAILLLSLLSYSLIGPALFADPESNLPACCRRNGKHHCSMMDGDMAATPASGTVADAQRMKCPLFPTGGAVLPHSDVALLGGSQPTGISLACHVAVPVNAESGYRVSLDGAHPKRGPPILL